MIERSYTITDGDNEYNYTIGEGELEQIEIAYNEWDDKEGKYKQKDRVTFSPEILIDFITALTETYNALAIKAQKQDEINLCPYKDPLHNHHDGCPSCYSKNPKAEIEKVAKSYGVEKQT